MDLEYFHSETSCRDPLVVYTFSKHIVVCHIVRNLRDDESFLCFSFWLFLQRNVTGREGGVLRKSLNLMTLQTKEGESRLMMIISKIGDCCREVTTCVFPKRLSNHT